MIAPGAWLGVLGGGQLGRMFAMAAHGLGYRVAVVDPDPECPAAGAADRLFCSALDDRAAWRELARLCAGVTVETENAPAAALRYLARRVRVAPGADALEITQNRAAEKRFLAAKGFPVTPFQILEKQEDLTAPGVAALLPGLLKASRFGYDGRGQVPVETPEDLSQAFAQLGGACVLEQRLELAAELSVILARGGDGSVAVHPVPLNRHVAGILDLSLAPAPIAAPVRRNAVAQAKRIANALDYRGVLCVEFFLLEEGRLLVNEIAPRPHNSGHFTIDACRTSQFEQQVRVLAGLPLGDSGMLLANGGAAMLNLLGDAWAGEAPRWERILSDPLARLHLYGKRVPRSGRKMGHITCIAESIETAAKTAASIRSQLAAERTA